MWGTSGCTPLSRRSKPSIAGVASLGSKSRTGPGAIAKHTATCPEPPRSGRRQCGAVNREGPCSRSECSS
eukprot:7154477-Prorocentrum_lima.AAC.1